MRKILPLGLVLSALCLPAQAADPDAHPLDPLTAEEIGAAARALKAVKVARPPQARFPEDGLFSLIHLNEPPKEEVLAWKPGSRYRREAFAIVYGAADNATLEGVVDVRDPANPKVLSFRQVPGVQPMMIDEELYRLDEIVRADERWQKAVRDRGLDPDDVELDPWVPGHVPGTTNRHLRTLTYLRGDAIFFWERPIEGIEALVDMTEGKVVELRVTPPIEVPERGFDLDERSIEKALGRLREAPKPLTITQPQGVSFEIRGHEVRWQKWRFRYMLHPREGLVLHQVGYEDDGKLRPVLYRLSFSEMAVPYGDPGPGWNWRCAFDVGEYGVGKSADSIEPGVEAPENAVLLPAVFANEHGRPRTRPRVVGIYERDGGMLWKHLEYTDDGDFNDARRGRELVVFFLATVGNYDYTISYIFRQDGSLEVDSGLSGVMLPQGVPAKTHVHGASGHKVTRQVVAPHHQHILSFRMDFDVDGTGNSVAEMNTRSMDPGPDNPAGNGMVMEETILPKEKDARRDMNLASARTWRVINPSKDNTLGDKVGYILVPGPNSVPYPLPDSSARKRAGFIDHHVWVTRYRAGELYAAGDYPNQHPGGEGLPKWVEGNESIDNQDVVLWYTMGVTHIPRPEEWPVMTTSHFGFKLLPGGFFVRNPALDVPGPR